MGQHRFRNLDAMRGICALTVVLFHCEGMFSTARIFQHGYLAVDLFFILSGFVLGHTYEKRPVAGSLLGDLIANVVYARWLLAKSTRSLLVLTLAGRGACFGYACFIAYGW